MKTSFAGIHSSRINHTPRLIALSLLLILLLWTLARAGAQPANKSTTSPAGVYKLISVDRKAVPCTINHEGRKMDIQSGTFTITTNGEITSVMTVSVRDRKNLRIERTPPARLTVGR